MVLIISSTSDKSTFAVSEWLDFKGIKWVRINGEDKVSLEFLGNDINFVISTGVSFSLSEIKSFWYRRGNFNLDKIVLSEIEQFKSFQQLELLKIFEFIFFKLKRKNSINSFDISDVNKLIVSSIAKEVGLNIPR